MGENGEKWDRIVRGIIVTLVFISCVLWMVTIPYDKAPDEKMRFTLVEYLARYMRLPHGGDAMIRDSQWGTSYAFTPYLPAIVSAIFVKIISFFSESPENLVLAARMTSVLSISGTAYFAGKIGNRIFDGWWRYLFPIVVCFVPQVIYLGAYINNDSMAILGSSIIVFFWLHGHDTKWSYKSCIGLSIGIVLIALSYYNAFGYILASAFFCVMDVCMLYDGKERISQLLKKGGTVIGIVVLLAGWWFLRNGIIYHGDFLGMSETLKYQEKYAVDLLKPSLNRTLQGNGYTLLDMLIKKRWVLLTFRSSIAGFENLVLWPKFSFFHVYKLLYEFAIFGTILNFLIFFKNKFFQDKSKLTGILFYVNLLVCVVIPVGLSIFYSYTSDFQPQGRYIMTGLIAYSVLLVFGWRVLTIIHNKWFNKCATVAIALVYIRGVIYCYATVIHPAYL